jgi:mono/diheme cytochrome c family protein
MRSLALCAVFVLGGCGSTDVVETTTAVQRGEAWASDPSFADTKFNAFACTTCHAVVAPPAGRVMPGAPLAGAARRKTFWGGRFLTLAEATDECARRFMHAQPFDPAAQRWIDLWVWLESIGDRGPTDPWPFEVQLAIADPPRGDAAAGKTVWDSTCRSCHGDAKTGEGRITDASGRRVATIGPADTIAMHKADGPSIVRQVVVEKVRHGSYLGFAGVMPPFSKQTLTDKQVADVLTYLGLYD